MRLERHLIRMSEETIYRFVDSKDGREEQFTVICTNSLHVADSGATASTTGLWNIHTVNPSRYMCNKVYSDGKHKRAPLFFTQFWHWLAKHETFWPLRLNSEEIWLQSVERFWLMACAFPRSGVVFCASPSLLGRTRRWRHAGDG